MSVKTRLYMKDPEVENGPYYFVEEVEKITPPTIKGRYEEIVYQGGTGIVSQHPSGIVGLDGGEITLYWNMEFLEATRNLLHIKLKRAVLNQFLVEFAISFLPSGWAWAFSAYVEEFQGEVKKEGKDRATLKLRPSGDLGFLYPTS
jgi:hypothetical protein